ncbi:2-phospho-L-lactate guanylyltransferase [Ancylobacter dichloromethanicus]|uniref:2-phospho-L-lactate guanylyltransferase n=1 Tax=Ancylobacter dichloromethanicus TaxID=518825 RepID=UPI00362097E8
MSTARGGVWAVVPVKEFAFAKQRLAGEFTPSFRHRLAQAMLCDVLAALRGARQLAGFAVITADPEAGRLAQDFGGRWLVETPVRGLNAAVSAAAAVLGAEGRGGMLVLPGDIPAVTSAEVDALIAGHGAGRAVSLVAAHDGQGTNAVLVSPPGMMTFAFGPMSFATSRRCAGARLRAAMPRSGAVSRPCARCRHRGAGAPARRSAPLFAHAPAAGGRGLPIIDAAGSPAMTI